MFAFLSTNEQDEAQKEISKLFTEPNRASAKEILGEQEPTAKKTKNKKLNVLAELATACGQINTFANRMEILNINQEMCYYISSLRENNLRFEEYWPSQAATLPILYSVAKMFCLIPASSVASESAFSVANFIQRKERSGLSACMLRYSLLLIEKDKLKEIEFNDNNVSEE